MDCLNWNMVGSYWNWKFCEKNLIRTDGIITAFWCMIISRDLHFVCFAGIRILWLFDNRKARTWNESPRSNFIYFTCLIVSNWCIVFYLVFPGDIHFLSHCFFFTENLIDQNVPLNLTLKLMDLMHSKMFLGQFF